MTSETSLSPCLYQPLQALTFLCQDNIHTNFETIFYKKKCQTSPNSKFHFEHRFWYTKMKSSLEFSLYDKYSRSLVHCYSPKCPVGSWFFSLSLIYSSLQKSHNLAKSFFVVIGMLATACVQLWGAMGRSCMCVSRSLPAAHWTSLAH